MVTALIVLAVVLWGLGMVLFYEFWDFIFHSDDSAPKATTKWLWTLFWPHFALIALLLEVGIYIHSRYTK